MLDNFMEDQLISYKILVNALKHGTLSHAYLFETNNYQQGFDMALSFAKYLLCNQGYTNHENCRNCHQCSMIDNHNYSELRIIESDGLWIKKEQLDNLQRDFSKKAVNGGKQVYIINHAERLNPQAANSILKFLEDPEPNIVAILVVNNKYSLLDTIVSRCQIISLQEHKNINKSMSTLEKIAYYLFNSKEDIQQFLEDKSSEDLVNKCLEFVLYYEKNGLDTLLFTNRLWHSVIKDKEDILNAFTILLLFYKDILNSKLRGDTEIFEYNENIQFIQNNNTEVQICDKINTILKQKEKIKFNINTSLLIDSLIMEMGK